jgi:hypothetical protein
MERAWYYTACLFAVAVLESIPRFIFEVEQEFFFVERLLLLSVFLVVAWFFHYALHERWHWSVTSGMFVIDAIAAVCFAVLLFLQLFSPWWAFVAVVLIVVRSALFSYLVSHRLTHLRSLVYISCFALLVLGELIITGVLIL